MKALHHRQIKPGMTIIVFMKAKNGIPESTMVDEVKEIGLTSIGTPLIIFKTIGRFIYDSRAFFEYTKRTRTKMLIEGIEEKNNMWKNEKPVKNYIPK